MKTANYLAAAALVTATMATPALAQDRMTRDQNQERARVRATATIDQRTADESRTYWRSSDDSEWHRDNWNRSDTGFWPGDLAANVVGGAVTTAGAIATAPFRGDSYASYDNGVRRNDWDVRYSNSYEGRAAGYYRGATPPNNGTWASNSLSASYAERNGFVCQPGTWFTGQDGRQHICQ